MQTAPAAGGVGSAGRGRAERLTVLSRSVLDPAGPAMGERVQFTSLRRLPPTAPASTTDPSRVTATMPNCLFASDLHGHLDRYEKLFGVVADERPAAVFLGGDLMPHVYAPASEDGQAAGDFVADFLVDRFGRLRDRLGDEYPRVFVILGNDDPRSAEAAFTEVAATGLWTYLHNRRERFGDYTVYGYSCVPPTPFRLKDWERYDVSRYVDPGCVSPEEGWRTVPVNKRDLRYRTIREDLERLTDGDDLGASIILFHTPPYRTTLDRAALDGKMIDHAPLDVHVGSIAVRRFTAAREPLLTLHGHVHESARITGAWRDMIGPTHCFGGSHDGSELAIVRFEPGDLEAASRELI